MPTLRRQGTRILRDTAADIELTIYVGGVATAPDAAPTVTVTAEDGTVIVNAATATIVGTKSKYTLTPTHTADVNSLTATWTATVSGVAGQVFLTYAQVVGALLFNLAEARSFDNSALTSSTTYPDATLIAARDRIAESFEDVMQCPVGLAYGREVLDGSGSSELWLDGAMLASVRSVKERTAGSATWTAYTASELADVLADRNGRLTRESLGSFTKGRRNIAVEYEHGYQPVPEELRRAALWLLRDQLTGSDLPRNAISQTDQLGTFNLSVPGLRGSFFGLPQVDEVVKRYSKRLPGVA
jgi:hypothetical protein